MKTREYDSLLHFEKLLDEFKEDALAAAGDNSFPSESKVIQYNLTRRNILAFVEELVLDSDRVRNNKENKLREDRDLLHEYLRDVVGDMTPYRLNEVSEMDDMDYCAAIIEKSKESYG